MLLAKRLPVPVSRAVVLAGPGPDLVVAGGLTPTGASGNGAFLLNPGTGAIRLVAGLATAVHDASGAVLAGHDMIFGGYMAAAARDRSGRDRGRRADGHRHRADLQGALGRGGARLGRAYGHGDHRPAPSPVPARGR